MKNSQRNVSLVDRLSVGQQIAAILVVALLTGIAIGGGWYEWRYTWERYLTSTYESGVSLFEIIQQYQDNPALSIDEKTTDFTISLVEPTEVTFADNSVDLRFPDLDGRSFETRFSMLHAQGGAEFTGERTLIRIYSDKLKYALSTISNKEHASLPARFGALVRALATYCSDNVVFVSVSDTQWLRVDGENIWGCSAAPPDRRLLIVILALIIFGAAITVGTGVAEKLTDLAGAIRLRAKERRLAQIDASGASEIRAIADSVNTFFDREKEQLEQRAVLLSGISHDLGAPATRLKLRAVLIEDAELRSKFERDINQITGMIESVLVYTRNEMNLEEPRRVSLFSLVLSVVDDYADIGQPVTLAPVQDNSFSPPSTIFGSNSIRSEVSLTMQNRMLCFCRPVAIRRALSNLIDNALKYGRSAVVSLDATSELIRISVQDAGGPTANFDFEDMIAPFKRGENAVYQEGVGLGLTIVSNILLSHGGQLTFEQNATGTCATIILPR